MNSPRVGAHPIHHQDDKTKENQSSSKVYDEENTTTGHAEEGSSARFQWLLIVAIQVLNANSFGGSCEVPWP